MTETHRIQYKRELTPELDLEKEVIAFLNSPQGGLIYLGIDATGQRLGVADAQGDLLKAKDRLKNNISPCTIGWFDLETEEAPPGVHCLKITVASGSEKPYAKKKYGLSEKGCFIRLGTAAEPMPVALIEKMFASRTRHTLGKIKSPRQSLSFEQLRIYFDEKRKPLSKPFKTTLELTTEDGALNYVAYLLSDDNGTSIKVAKYQGKDRTHLLESNEYGYCSLIKATKAVLDKLDLENKTASTITAKERIDVRRWPPSALREAVINAIIHNDYTREVPPKFEIFADRIEITSACALPEGLSQTEFFEGYSIPRNKELMRVFKDLAMAEHLGSGLPRITEFFGPECFQFTDNFLRLSFPAQGAVRERETPPPATTQATPQKSPQVTPQQPPQDTPQVTPQVALQVTPQVAPPVTPHVEQLLRVMSGDHARQELQAWLGLADREHFRKAYLLPALLAGFIEPTLPDKPNSRLQQYRRTEQGRSALK